MPANRTFIHFYSFGWEQDSAETILGRAHSAGYPAKKVGVFKNAIDGFTRPPEERMGVFAGKPVGLIGSTPGNFGTAFSQYAWLPVLRVLGTQVWSGRLLWVSGAMGKFDDQGNLTDDGVKNQLKKYMAGFTEFVRRMKA